MFDILLCALWIVVALPVVMVTFFFTLRAVDRWLEGLDSADHAPRLRAARKRNAGGV